MAQSGGSGSGDIATGDSETGGHHDMGGLPAGPVDRDEHDVALWEKRVDALLVLLSAPPQRVMTVDQLRRGIESLPADAYDRMGYYERWIASIAAALLGAGVVTRAELEAALARAAERRGVAVPDAPAEAVVIPIPPPGGEAGP